MEPQRSLRKGLSRRGRLENAWASALADADPRAGLVSLRAVLAGIEEYQDRTADLWPSFQQSFLGPRFLPLVEAADLDRLAQVGERMAAEGRIGLHQSWVPLADAAVARSGAGDRDFAVSLYTRLYRSAFVHEESRSIAATALARLGADQDDQLAIYVDIFRRYATVPPEVHQMTGRLLGAGFDDETGRVERAFALATHLSAAGLRLAGLDRTLGLGALLLHRETADAADHFTRACGADPTDGEALRGLIAARLHSGAYAEALTAVRGREAVLTPRGAELTDLCRMLEWLELDPGSDGPPGPATAAPLTAVRLATIGDGGDSRPWGRYAQGRAQLLEGNADLAAKNLVVVADAFPDRSDLGYHAAWAQLLCGEHEAAGRRCRALLADGDAHAWPLGCLLADADPGRRATDEERTVMKGAAHAFTAVVTARLRLAEGQEPGVELAWDPLGAEGATVPELLEALRTLLGVEVTGGRRNAVGHLTALSLFGRLPLPEQLLWRALSALPEDRDRARSLLEQAGGQGLDRATLVLAVTELTAGNPDRAADLLDGVRGPKAELVRARAELALGRTVDAVRRLDRLPTPRARYESGALALREAAALWAGGEADRAVQRAGWAAARLIDAQVTGPGALPPVPADAGRLARAARLLAERAARPADGTGAAPWRIVRHHSRTAWLLGLGQLLAEPREAEPVLVEALVAWVGEADGPTAADVGDARAVEVLALALGRACLLGEDPAVQDELAGALEVLAAAWPLPVVAREARRAASLAGRHDERAKDAGADEDAGADAPADVRDDPLLALPLAAAALKAGDRADAVRLLRAVGDGPDEGAEVVGQGGGAEGPKGGVQGGGAEGPENDVPDEGAEGADGAGGTGEARRAAAQVVAFVAQALEGEPPAELPSVGGNPALPAPLLVVQAAGHLPAQRAKAAEALTLALRDHDLTGLVDVAATLPALCARVARARRRDGRAQALAEVVRRLADRLTEDSPEADGLVPFDAVTLARCAAAVGDHEVADRLWRHALNADTDAGADTAAAEYGKYLCHRAVAAKADGDPARALELLGRAAGHLPEEHPAHRHRADLERNDRSDALLSHLFPDAAQTWERPGRLPAVEAAMADHPVWQALAADQAAAIERELTRFFARRATRNDIPVLHSMAVVYREEALAKLTRTGAADEDLVTATVLWVLLLCHPGFWEAFADRPGSDDAGTIVADAATGPDAEYLRTSLTDELLTLHRSHGARALAEHREDQARLHLNCLTALRQGTHVTRTLLAEGPLAGVLPGVDEDLFAAVSDRAGALLDDWSTDLVRAAEKRVDDPERVRALPDGIDKDYEEGISSLANAVDHGFAPGNVLCTVVAWHNEWQNCLYQMGDRDHMRTVVTKAVRYAELLAQGAVKGRPHLRENQLLAAHYVDRGLLDRDTGKAIAYFELAKEWNPANTNAPQLLEQYRQDALFSAALEHIKARRYPKALAELDRVPRTDATRKTLDRLRTSTLINHGYVLLDAERLDEAERAVRDAERVAAAGDDPKMREEAAKALRAVATGMNNRAVAMSNAALSNLERSVRIGPNAVEGELQAAISLLRRAERIAPEAATRDNITRIEDLLRRLRP
ncbi:hypothetical protein [Streptomyces sp. NBC_00118]|uniref:hypothetical protein n=1 Tax=unclassified Streptomyces TaxID=2593676 RepID=UPI00308E4066|nr:hypothetical protein OG518_26330 [Streptomyces sp. NBC_01397]